MAGGEVGRKGKIVKVWDNFKTIINVFIRGDVESTLIFPFGIYAKPLPKENIITIDNGKLTVPITDDKKIMVNLKDGDVVYQDGKSYIHLQHSKGDMIIKTNKLSIECTEFNLTVVGAINIVGSSYDITSPTLNHNMINIGFTHTHKVVGNTTLTPQ